jgi:cell division septal protein FtsQ
VSFAVPEQDPGRQALRPGLRRDAVFAVRRTAPARRRFPWRRWLFSTLAVVLLAGGGWALTQSGLFSVARIETGAYRFTDEHQLKVALSPLLGRNLWTVAQPDLAAAATRLPWVREVYMERRWPRAIGVELVEWRPLLVVAEPGAPPEAPTLVLVDDGRVLRFPAGMMAPALPVLTGVVVERSAGGPARLPQELAPAVLELVSALESTGLDAVTPVDFVVARPDGFGIVLSKDADQLSYGTLLVGREGFADRLSRYMTARDHIERNLEIDLRFKDRLTVRPRPVQEGEEGEEGEEGGDAAKDGAATAATVATAKPAVSKPAATKPAATKPAAKATAQPVKKAAAKPAAAKADAPKKAAPKKTTAVKAATAKKTDPARKTEQVKKTEPVKKTDQ